MAPPSAGTSAIQRPSSSFSTSTCILRRCRSATTPASGFLAERFNMPRPGDGWHD
jgi:hypothetical protein